MARTIAAATSGSSRNRGVLMLAAIFGILSALLMFAFLNSKGGSKEATVLGGGPAESVVVATQDINAGDKITSHMLEPRSFPVSTLLTGHVLSKDSESIVGKVATSPIFQGEQVISAKVTSFEGQNGISWKVPAGMRALSLQVPHEAWIAAGLPQPGDRVDILAITTLTRTDPLTGQERPDVIAGYMAEDVEVLAVSQTLVKRVLNVDAAKAKAGDGITPAASGSVVTTTSDDKGATYEKAISITIALPPDLAAKVALVDAMKDDAGQYRILPRQKGDATPISGTNSWSYDDIFPAKKK